MPFDLMQVLSLFGATLLLVAFLASAAQRMDKDSLVYGLLNAIGAACLVATVVEPLNLGVLIMESVWSLASLGICWQALRRGRAGA